MIICYFKIHPVNFTSLWTVTVHLHLHRETMQQVYSQEENNRPRSGYKVTFPRWQNYLLRMKKTSAWCVVGQTKKYMTNHSLFVNIVTSVLVNQKANRNWFHFAFWFSFFFRSASSLSEWNDGIYDDDVNDDDVNYTERNKWREANARAQM